MSNVAAQGAPDGQLSLLGGWANRGKGDVSGDRVSSPRVSSTTLRRRSTGSGSEVIVAAKPRPSLIVTGCPTRTLKRSIRSARSRGEIRRTGT